MTIDADETYGRGENFTAVPRTRSEDERLFNTGDERTFPDRTGRTSAPEEAHYDPDIEDDDPDGTGDPEGWGMLAAGTGGLIAIGVGVWLFSWGGWIAVLTTSAVLGVAGGGTYVAAADRRRNGPRSPRMRRTSWGGSPSTSRSAGGRSRSGSGLKFPSLLGGRSASTPKPAGRSAAPARTAARSHKPTAGSGRVAPAARTGRAGAAARPSAGAPRFPGRPSAAATRSTPSASPRGAPAAKSKLRRGMVALGTGVAAGADAYARYQKAKQNKRFAYGKRANVGPLAWMMLSALEGLAVYLRDGTTPRATVKDEPAKKRKKKARPPRPAAPTTPAGPTIPRRESLTIEIPTPTRAETEQEKRDRAAYWARIQAAKQAARRDDERDGDAWRNGRPTPAPRTRSERTMPHRTPANFAYHTARLSEASGEVIGTFRPNFYDGVDVPLAIQEFTMGMAAFYRDHAADITALAEWIETESPAHPGVAEYWRHVAATAEAMAEAAVEAGTAHLNLDATDFENRSGRPNADQANLLPGGASQI